MAHQWPTKKYFLLYTSIVQHVDWSVMTSCSLSTKKLSSRLEFRMSMLLPLDFAIFNAPTFNSDALLTALV